MGRDGYKTAVRLFGAVPEWSKKAKQNYKTAVGCLDG